MATYVLVHGAWHAAWQWERIVPGMRAAGHQVIVPNLPGRHPDPTPPAMVSLEDYVDTVSASVKTADEPPIVVGHSLGGIIITLVAERYPEKVARLVYLSGMLISDGVVGERVAEDIDSAGAGNLDINAEQGWCALHPGAVREVLYTDCTDNDVAWASRQLVVEPLAPFVTPISASAGRFGRVPRAYIECTDDRAVTYTFQKRMQGELPCAPVLTMSSAHSPFLSQPDELITNLTGLAS